MKYMSSIIHITVSSSGEAKFLLGYVRVGAEANQRSKTTYSFARVDITGKVSGVNMPIIFVSTVPGIYA